MGLVEVLMEKLTIPYTDREEKDKTERISKRKGDFQVDSFSQIKAAKLFSFKL